MDGSVTGVAGGELVSAAESTGASRITKARLRSAKASAAELIILSKMPGVSRMLKIGTLSSEVSAWNTSVKSFAWKVVEKPVRFATGALNGDGRMGNPVP